MQIYTTMDQVFAIFSYEAMLTWGTYCKIYMKQKIKSLEFLHVGVEKKSFNNSKWMDVSIALYELDVIK
jgi:hypothetical protein